jgi:hypothetical protein
MLFAMARNYPSAPTSSAPQLGQRPAGISTVLALGLYPHRAQCLASGGGARKTSARFATAAASPLLRRAHSRSFDFVSLMSDKLRFLARKQLSNLLEQRCELVSLRTRHVER